MRIGIGLLVAALFVLGIAPAHGQDSPPPTQALGMATTPRLIPEPTLLDYIDAFRLTHDNSVNANAFTETWSGLEPTAGELATTDFVNGINWYQSTYAANQTLIGIQVLNTTDKETPADLQAVDFDDPQMLSRFNAFIDTLLGQISQPPTYLSIGNEVDIYLNNHPDQWGSYQAFYDGAAAHIHEVAPEIQVGVTMTYGGLRDFPDEAARLNQHSDVFIVTYYPLGEAFTADDPDAPLTDFPKMVASAGGLPVVLQEVGYPSAALLDSSEAEQAQFVRSVFAAWSQAGDAIPFLDFFLLHDLTDDFCSSLESYYGLKHPNFHAYLCTLGLRQADGTPKQAWQTFVDEAAKWQAGM